MWSKKSILDEVQRMQSEMDRLFEQIAGGDLWEGKFLPSSTALTGYKRPVADCFETEKEYVTSIELPGVEKKDIIVNATDGGVEVKVEKRKELGEEDKKKGSYRLERSYAGYYRFFSVPENADAGKVDAKYNNGVLELHIPKKVIKESARKQIPVK